MSGIAGIESGGEINIVEKMLAKIEYRGNGRETILDRPGTTIGTIKNKIPQNALAEKSGTVLNEDTFTDERLPFAVAWPVNDGLLLARDRIGARPLYYGYDSDGRMCFASEVKALMESTQDIHEFPPGAVYRTGQGIQILGDVEQQDVVPMTAHEAVNGLRERLEDAVGSRVDREIMGSWLSGGIDSSVIVAILRPYVKKLHTFAAGLHGAPDVEYARLVAKHVKTEHHEVILQPDDLPKVLDEVIYALESFDALLIRSSIMNYLVSQYAKDYVDVVFSGEGGDELFAGYEYLQTMPKDQLPGELVDITRRLHNTALQRVDRSASANGLVAHVPFVDGEVLDFALTIPSEYKLQPGTPPVEKWVLRKAASDLLPSSVLWRTKSKFWEGSGVEDILAQYADSKVSDDDFKNSRELPNGWILNSKEEYLYYRHFYEHFGHLPNLDWMGRTKGAPVQ
jgi:asparagine synthase (glutamine-hydrolysing)